LFSDQITSNLDKDCVCCAQAGVIMGQDRQQLTQTLY